jgi:hypothetical protein
MKFACDNRRSLRQQKRAAKDAAERQWHRKFAWLPIRMGFNDCRWLETVARRKVTIRNYSIMMCFDRWEYEPLENHPDIIEHHYP